MTKSYIRVGLLARLPQLGLAALLAGGATIAQGQSLPYTQANAFIRTGTYTDLGATGTVIATANNDDANSTAQNIGFSFNFNGAAFTQFVLNTNGLIKLGATAPAANDYITYAEEYTGGPLNMAVDVNVIMPFNNDLEPGTGTPEYRVFTTGTPGSQVCTIQWKNVRDKSKLASSTIAANVDSQFANFAFQVKLYETSNNVEFVYGPSTATTNAEFFKFANVGLKGSGAAANQVLLAQRSSSAAWDQAAFISNIYPAATTPGSTQGFNFKRSVRPVSGLTYAFTLPVSADAAVAKVYTYDQLGTPWQSPTVIRALVRNAGTAAISNVSVGLTVTGANTITASPQVVATLAAGATAVVTFPNVPLPNIGNNTVTVTTTLAGDANPSNNSASTTVVTNATTSSYRTPAVNSANVVFGGGEDIYFAAKFTLNAPRDITTVTALISSAGASPTSKSSVGETVYAVVINATTGALLGRSANYVITTADIDAYHTFALNAPITVPAGDVLAGMSRLASSSATLEFYPFGVQDENPTRSNTFYIGDVAMPTAPSPLFATAPNNVYKLPYSIGTLPPATCPTVSGVSVSNVTQTGAQVSFTGPANGTGYEVVYVPTGTTPTGSSPFVTGAASPITLPAGTLTAGTGYDIYVRALCGATDRSALAGPTFFSTPCAPPVINNFPYAQNFDVIANGQNLPCGITVQDINADGSTWEPLNFVPSGVNQIPVARSQPFAMVYITNVDGITAADDWFYLPAMRFTAGTRRRLSFYYRNNSRPGLLDESLEVKYGTAATPAGQTTLLYSNAAIATGPVTPTSPSYTLADNTTTPAVADIAPAATGLYYIGFHANSQADRGFLAVDDITVSAVLGTSETLTRAVNVYPNPTNTGTITLAISGANAKGAMQVEVTNMLGQRVYSSTVKDNFSNELNLSNLAAGIYSLKVKNGSEYMQQQISIVK